MDKSKPTWLERRASRERRYEVARRIAESARSVVPHCIVADETPGNSLPLEIDFGVEIYNVPQDKRIPLRKAVSPFTFSLLRNERLIVHVHISSDPPPAKASIIVGATTTAVSESQIE